MSKSPAEEHHAEIVDHTDPRSGSAREVGGGQRFWHHSHENMHLMFALPFGVLCKEAERSFSPPFPSKIGRVCSKSNASAGK